MRRHLHLTLIAFAFTGHAQAIDTALCTLDYEYYRDQARALWKTKPGARLDDIAVHWIDPKYGEMSVTIGGCMHFGLRITSTRTVIQGDRRALTRFAVKLISNYWPKSFAKSTIAALQGVKPTIKNTEEGFVLSFESLGFDELMIIQRQHGRRSEVEVLATIPT